MPPKKRKGSDDEDNREADVDTEGPADGPATVKRQRVSRACDQCRAARERCDGKPQCLPCISQNRACTYQTNPKKRGVQTGYIRTLEVALAWIFEKVPESESTLYRLLTRKTGEGRSLLAGSNTDRFHRKWRKSRVQKGIEQVLSGGDAAQQQADASSAMSEDESDMNTEADQSRGQSGIQDMSQLTPASPVSATQLSQRGPPSSRGHPEPPAHHAAPTLSNRCRLKLPSNHWRLLDIYFSYTHPWLPILEKQDIFQASYQYSSENSIAISPEDPTTAVYAELWAALALASFQDAASATPSMSGTADDSSLSASEIYSIARKLVPSEDAQYQVHHVRALLLLAVVNLGAENVRSAWFLVGTAVQAFLDITGREDREQPRIRSVLIACFILDTIISATYCKPPHLGMEELADVMPIPEGALDEWQPWTSCDGFGPGRAANLQSRNPAHCLSSFNQLYAMLKVVRQYLESGGRRTDLGSKGNIADLRQAIQPASPFRSFILSSDLSPASVPSPYVLRTVYLWSTALMGGSADYQGTPLLETLEQYVANFGVCGVPAAFTPFLSLVLEHPDFASLHPLDQERLEALRLKLIATWGQASQSSARPAVSRTRVRAQGASHPEKGQQRPPGSSVETSHQFPVPATVSTPSPFYNSSVLTQNHASPAAHIYRNMQSSYMISAYPQTNPMTSPSVASLTNNSSENDRRGVIANAALTPMVEPIHHHHNHSIQTSFNQTSMDYDALLDDLASIDYSDRIDADPQFMMNLGFAPDCDITEILTRDFGTG